MLQIVCVKHGTKYGAEYVNILFDMVARNLEDGTQGKFVCFTDDASGLDNRIEIRSLPGKLSGWWNKIYLFKDGLFPDGDRIVYFDLDTVICGPINDIAAYDGPFAVLRDVYRPTGLQSSVMAWEAGKQGSIWDRFVQAGYPDVAGGDQIWIEHCLKDFDLWQRKFPKAFVSFKAQASQGLPKGAKVVFFHGEPRPHEVTEGWVPRVWKIGGGTAAELITVANTPEEIIHENILAASQRACSKLELQEAHDRVALIVAGGPSLKDYLGHIRLFQSQGATLFSCNNTHAFLKACAIQPDCQVMLDARYDNIAFVPADEDHCIRYYASQCHPKVLDLAGEDLVLWHPLTPGIFDTLGEDFQAPFIGGGTTVGLRAIVLAYVLGYRKIKLFGFDSSYSGNNHHAYMQRLNDGEKVLDVSVADKSFKAAPWMVQQAEDFGPLMEELTALGVEFMIYGDGLIPTIVEEMNKAPVPPAEERAQAILDKIMAFKNPIGAEIGVFAGDLSKRLLRRPDLSLYMVDSWSATHSDSYKETEDFHTELSQSAQDEFALHAQAVTSFAKERAKIIRKSSVEAAHDIADGSLDFAFIDADHSYEGCKADIEAWLPKVRPGGFICGHDYENTHFPKFGVKRAVDELMAQSGFMLELGKNYTWFAIKEG